MKLIDKVMQTYGKDSDWAMKFIDLCRAISENREVFEHLCHLSRDTWATNACNVTDYNCPRYAYFRGKSDTYNDLPMSFISNYEELIQC